MHDRNDLDVVGFAPQVDSYTERLGRAQKPKLTDEQRAERRLKKAKYHQNDRKSCRPSPAAVR